MRTIRDLNAPPHFTGRVEAIVVRGRSRDLARTLPATLATARVLESGAIAIEDAARALERAPRDG